MPVFNGERVLLHLKKTPSIYALIMKDVDQVRASTARDGADGWTVLEVMAHLNDYEAIFTERTSAILDHENPALVGYDQAQLAIERNYAGKELAQVYSEWKARRQENIRFLSALPPEAWSRTGLHPSCGQITLLDLWLNTIAHDVNHAEQIIRSLEQVETT